jgi:hypothetical protein
MTISDVHHELAKAAPTTEMPKSEVQSLTQRILHSVAHPAPGDEFDLHREFDYDPVLVPLGSCYPEWR